jgi:hypothetical protein
MPSIKWYPDRTVIRKGKVRVLDVPQAYTLSFGDGTTIPKDLDDVYPYTYAAAGPYALNVTRIGETEPAASLLLNVLDAVVPNVTISAPANTQKIRVTFNDPEMPVVGRYTVDWTPTESEDVLAEPDKYVERLFAPGVYPIRVTDHWSALSMVQDVAVSPVTEDPGFSLTEDTSDAGRMTAQVEVLTAASAGPGDTLTVDWGDGDTESIAAVVSTTVSHEYAYDDEYMVELSYTDDSTLNTTQFVWVPFTD